MFSRFRKDHSRGLAERDKNHEPPVEPDRPSDEDEPTGSAEPITAQSAPEDVTAPADEAGLDEWPSVAGERASDSNEDRAPTDDHDDQPGQAAAQPDNDEDLAEELPLPWQAVAPSPPMSARRPRHQLKGLRKLKKSEASARLGYTPHQRLLLLDTWQRSGLSAGDFADLVGVSKHTLYSWKRLFEKLGPEGLADQPKGTRKRGSRLSEVTKRTILMLKAAHPEWGVERICDMLLRGPGLSASPTAIARLLRENGYQRVEEPTEPNRPPKVQTFERARPNQLWQTDLFTFMLKRQNRRLYLVAFMDDHSRFIVSYGLHASASTSLVLEVLEAAIANYGPPEEILTDNGPQFVTWRGKSRFTRQLEKRGIKQIVARPKRPQTLGKVERFWGTLWRELVEASVFVDLADARERIGHFIDYYNFQRAHRGIDGLVPADRFFGASRDVLRTLKERAASNALELARHGKLKAPFYLTGQVSGQAFSVHSEGERLILQRDGKEREEIELVGSEEGAIQPEHLPQPICPQGVIGSLPGEPADADPPAPGESAIDRLLADDPQEGGQS